MDPLPFPFSRRDPVDQADSESPKQPRRSLSVPSSSSSSLNEHSGLNGRLGVGGRGSGSTSPEFDKYERVNRDRVGLNGTVAATGGSTSGLNPVDGDNLENGHTSPILGATYGRRISSRGDMSGMDHGLDDETGSKGGKSYVNGAKDLPTVMQGRDAATAAGHEDRTGYGSGSMGSKGLDPPRQLLTPILSPGGPNHPGQRRSSVAGPVTGLGVALENTVASQIEPPANSPGDPFGVRRDANGSLSGRNEKSGDVSPRQDQRKTRVRKLSSAKMHELTSSPESTILRTVPSENENSRKMSLSSIPPISLRDEDGPDHSEACVDGSELGSEDGRASTRKASVSKGSKNVGLDDVPEIPIPKREKQPSSRTVSSTEASVRRRRSSVGSKTELPSQSSTHRSKSGRLPKRIDLDASKSGQFGASVSEPHPSPMPQSIPLPPLSVPTYLQLELSSNRPSPLYIHQSVTNDFPYESSRVKIERLQNFLLLPPQLEQVLWFGAFACLDAWLFSFTILPLRFFKALFILSQSWAINIGAEVQFLSSFVFEGVRRVWRRRQRRASTLSVPGDSKDADEVSRPRAVSVNTVSSRQDTSAVERDSRNRAGSGQYENNRRHRASSSRKHRRNKSIPSALVPDDKADILKGSLMIATCCILMYFDASRMYHWIRGQAAIKLYVIYNVLEVSLYFYA